MSDNWMLKAVLSANADGMLKTLKSVNVASNATRKYLLDVAKSAGNLGAQVGMPLGLVSGALGAFSVVGIKNAVMGFAELTSQIQDSSKGVGLSAEEYQRLTFIAGQSGIAAESMGSAVGRLNKNIAMAATGKNKDLAELFRQSGIAMRDASGHMRSGADLLPEVADLFERNQNAALQARMGNAIFGKSWQELAPLLNDGKAGIDQLTARYEKLGLVIDNNTVAAGEAFGDQVDQLKMVAESYGNSITAKLLPALSPLIERTIEWATKNRELIATNVSTFITGIADDLSKVDWSGVVKGARDFVDGLKWCIEFVHGTKNALIGLVVVMNAQALIATWQLGAAIVRLGFGFSALALKALAPVAPLQLVTTGMTVAQLRAATLLATVGRLSAAFGVAGAAFSGWQIGSMLNDYVINPTVEKLTGQEGNTLGGWMYDKFNSDPMQPLTPPQQKVGGEIKITLDGAPPGTRIMPNIQSGPIVFKMDMGYRSGATGMPY